MITGFSITTPNKITIRFEYDLEHAPATSEAFDACLPLEIEYYHAKVSGQEIWSENAPKLNVAQENASVFILPGEVVIGPNHHRNKVSGFMGIMYGEGQLLDAGNIFAKVDPHDLEALQKLGEEIWLNGKQTLLFQSIHE